MSFNETNEMVVKIRYTNEPHTETDDDNKKYFVMSWSDDEKVNVLVPKDEMHDYLKRLEYVLNNTPRQLGGPIFWLYNIKTKDTAYLAKILNRRGVEEFCRKLSDAM